MRARPPDEAVVAAQRKTYACAGADAEFAHVRNYSHTGRACAHAPTGHARVDLIGRTYSDGAIHPG